MSATLHRDMALRRIALLSGFFAAALGGSVLAGWTFNITALKSVLPGLVTMMPNTAVAMVLCGGVLALLSGGMIGTRGRFCATGMSGIAVTLAALTLSEHLFGWKLGLDQWLFRDAVDAAATSSPGRMPASTAFCFVLMGCSLWVASRPFTRRMNLPLLQALSVAIVVVGGFALAGYVLDAMFRFRWWNYTGMAVHTAAGFMLLGGGLLAFVRSEGGLRWSLSTLVTGGFVVGVVSLLAAAGVSYYFINQLRQSTAWVSHTQEVLKKIEEITANMAALGSSQRSYINTGDETLLKQNGEMKGAILKDLYDFRNLTADNPRQQERAGRLDPLIARRIDCGEQTIAARRKEGLSAAEQIIATGTSVAFSDRIRRLIQEMEEDEYSLLAQRQQKEESISTTTFLLLPLGVFLSITLSSLGLFFLNAGVGERARTEARLAAMVESSDDAIIGKDLQGIITSWNAGARRTFGYTAGEMVGQPMARLIPPNREQEEMVILGLIQRGESVKHLDTERVCKDGSMVPVSITVSPIKDSTGKIVGASNAARDITERQRVERALRESHENLEHKVTERTAELHLAKESAEAAGRAKSEFLASMSHELRTPLNGIIGFSEFLVDGKPGTLNMKQKEYLEDILNSGRHLLQLINDVLDLSKVEAGKIELIPERFPLHKAVEEVCSVGGPMAQKKQIHVNLSVAPGLLEVTLDQVRFKQVVYNLLSNALKFTDDGGRVEIQCALHGLHQFKLAVRDSGIGIKPEDLPRLFKEFEQIESGTARRHEGTGLGLALTRKIVEMQGGCISVASEFGKGTLFTVILPLSFQKGQT